MNNRLKILLLGDYSNCHHSLADGLRQLDCDVTVISNGSSWMNCSRDVDISRKPGLLSGAQLYGKLAVGPLRKALKGYDIVAIHDPNFAQLRPKRLRPFFDRLCRENKSVFLTAMSTNIGFLDMLEANDSPLRYSEWFVDGKPSRMNLDNPQKWRDWHQPELVGYQNHVFSKLDGAVSVLYEYHLGIERSLGSNRSAYGGLPIDTQRFEFCALPNKINKVKLFLGRDRTRKLMKGTDLLEFAAKNIVEKYPDRAELTIVENRPFDEFCELLKNSHVVLDQIYSYTPATTALMAMSYGLNVVSGAEPEFYEFIGEKSNHPIINAPLDFEALTAVIEDIVTHPERIAERGRQCREFVVKHNDSRVVAKRFLDFWTKKLEEKKC